VDSLTFEQAPTWTAFKDLIKTRFTSWTHEFHQRKLLSQLHQVGEDIEGYIAEFSRQTREIKDLNEGEALYAFQRGLPHEIVQHILQYRPKTVGEATEMARQYQLSHGRYVLQTPSSHLPGYKPNPKPNSSPMELNRFTSNRFRRSTNQRRNFRPHSRSPFRSTRTSSRSRTPSPHRRFSHSPHRSSSPRRVNALTPPTTTPNKPTVEHRCSKCGRFGHNSKDCKSSKSHHQRSSSNSRQSPRRRSSTPGHQNHSSRRSHSSSSNSTNRSKSRHPRQRSHSPTGKGKGGPK